MRILKLRFMLVLVIFLLVSMSTAFAEEVITLRMATHNPANVPRTEGNRLLKEEIERATDGRVKIDIYYNGSLVVGAEALDATRDRVADMAEINPAYYSTKLPLHSGMMCFLDVPKTHKQKVEVMKMAYAKYPELLGEFERYNQKIIWQYFPIPQGLIASKPVRSLEDWKGLKIRASSETYLRVIEALGGIPVSTPAGTDTYLSLQTGILEGILSNIDSIISNTWWEPAPYLFVSDKMDLWLPFTVTMNKDVWESLTSEIKEQINEAVRIVDDRFNPFYEQSFYDVIDVLQDNKCKEIVEVSEADLQVWRNLKILDELKKELGQKAEKIGIKDGEQFIKDMEGFMKIANNLE